MGTVPSIRIGMDVPPAGGRRWRRRSAMPRISTGSSPARPANYVTHLQGAQVWSAQVVHKDEASYIPPAKYAVLHAAVLDGLRCAGWREGRGPRESRASAISIPKDAACKGADGPSCLTAAQVETARKIYAGRRIRRASRYFRASSRAARRVGRRCSGRSPWRWRMKLFKYSCFKDRQLGLSDV